MGCQGMIGLGFLEEVRGWSKKVLMDKKHCHRISDFQSISPGVKKIKNA